MHWIWFRSNKLKIKSWSFHDSYSPHDWSIDVENTTLIDCASSILCNVMSLSNFPVRVFFTKGTSSENHLIFCLPSKSECNVVRTATDGAFRRFEWFFSFHEINICFFFSQECLYEEQNLSLPSAITSYFRIVWSQRFAKYVSQNHN